MAGAKEFRPAICESKRRRAPGFANRCQPRAFRPVAHSHPIAQHGVPTTWQFWAMVDREYLSKCDVLAVLMLPGWHESVGVQAEIGIARELRRPVVYLSPD